MGLVFSLFLPPHVAGNWIIVKNKKKEYLFVFINIFLFVPGWWGDHTHSSWSGTKAWSVAYRNSKISGKPEASETAHEATRYFTWHETTGQCCPPAAASKIEYRFGVLSVSGERMKWENWYCLLLLILPLTVQRFNHNVKVLHMQYIIPHFTCYQFFLPYFLLFLQLFAWLLVCDATFFM